MARMAEYKLESEPRWVQLVWARAYAGVPIRFGPVQSFERSAADCAMRVGSSR